LKGDYEIRDLWQKKDIGSTDKIFEAELPSHDVIVVRLTPAEKDTK
jgi:alpha-galactosidase